MGCKQHLKKLQSSYQSHSYKGRIRFWLFVQGTNWCRLWSGNFSKCSVQLLTSTNHQQQSQEWEFSNFCVFAASAPIPAFPTLSHWLPTYFRDFVHTVIRDSILSSKDVFKWCSYIDVATQCSSVTQPYRRRSFNTNLLFQCDVSRKATARAILQAYALPQRGFTKNIEAAQCQFESKY